MSAQSAAQAGERGDGDGGEPDEQEPDVLPVDYFIQASYLRMIDCLAFDR